MSALQSIPKSHLSAPFDALFERRTPKAFQKHAKSTLKCDFGAHAALREQTSVYFPRAASGPRTTLPQIPRAEGTQKTLKTHTLSALQKHSEITLKCAFDALLMCRTPKALRNHTLVVRQKERLWTAAKPRAERTPKAHLFCNLGAGPHSKSTLLHPENSTHSQSTLKCDFGARACTPKAH